jgi:hypothetical protein
LTTLFDRITRFAWFAALPLGLFFLIAPVKTLITSLVYDDAFYYLQIAVNIAAGRGSTFDGFTATNGYHPLWMSVIVAIRTVVEDRELFLRIVAAVSAILAVASWVQFGRLLVQYYGRVTPLLCAAFFSFPLLFFFAVYGLETWLSMLLLLLLLRSVLAGRMAEAPLLHGLLAALTVLARLDLIVPVTFLLAYKTLQLRRNGVDVLRPVLLCLLPPLLLLGGYALASQLWAGIPYPVSSLVKSTTTLPVPLGYPGVLGRAGQLFHMPSLPFVAAVLIMTVLSFLIMPAERAKRYHLVLLLASATQLALLVLFTVWGEMIWYYYPAAASVLFAVPEMEKWIKRVAGNLALSVVPLSALLLVLYAYVIYGKLRLDEIDSGALSLYAASQYVARNLPDGVRLGTPFAGIFGYFSGHDVLNMDGLAADKAYLHAGLAGEIPRFLRAHRIRYLLLPVAGNDDGPWYFSYLATEVDPCDVMYSTGVTGRAKLKWILVCFP